jgi:hypothetical protein
VGLGAQDSFGDAQAFLARHRLSFRLLWEDGFRSWQGFGINRQPAAVLVGRDGARLKTWTAFSERDLGEVVRLAQASA